MTNFLNFFIPALALCIVFVTSLGAELLTASKLGIYKSKGIYNDIKLIMSRFSLLGFLLGYMVFIPWVKEIEYDDSNETNFRQKFVKVHLVGILVPLTLVLLILITGIIGLYDNYWFAMIIYRVAKLASVFTIINLIPLPPFKMYQIIKYKMPAKFNGFVEDNRLITELFWIIPLFISAPIVLNCVYFISYIADLMVDLLNIIR